MHFSVRLFDRSSLFYQQKRFLFLFFGQQFLIKAFTRKTGVKDGLLEPKLRD